MLWKNRASSLRSLNRPYSQKNFANQSNESYLCSGPKLSWSSGWLRCKFTIDVYLFLRVLVVVRCGPATGGARPSPVTKTTTLRSTDRDWFPNEKPLRAFSQGNNQKQLQIHLSLLVGVSKEELDHQEVRVVVRRTWLEDLGAKLILLVDNLKTIFCCCNRAFV